MSQPIDAMTVAPVSAWPPSPEQELAWEAEKAACLIKWWQRAPLSDRNKYSEKHLDRARKTPGSQADKDAALRAAQDRLRELNTESLVMDCLDSMKSTGNNGIGERRQWLNRYTKQYGQVAREQLEQRIRAAWLEHQEATSHEADLEVDDTNRRMEMTR